MKFNENNYFSAGDSGIARMVERNIDILDGGDDSLTESNGMSLLRDPRMALLHGDPNSSVLANHIDHDFLSTFDTKNIVDGILGELGDAVLTK